MVRLKQPAGNSGRRAGAQTCAKEISKMIDFPSNTPPSLFIPPEEPPLIPMRLMSPWKWLCSWLCSWLCACCLLQLAIPPVQAAPAYPALQSHVNDYAGVLAGRGPAIDAQLKAFEARSGHQVFVLTVDSTGAQSIDAYALAVFEQWQPGRKGRDDGALLVLAVADRAMRIEAGYGLEGTLTDVRSARIVRDVIAPHLKQGDYDGGVAAGVDAMLAVIAGNPDSGAPPAASAPVAESAAARWIVLGLFGSLALFAVGMSLFAGLFGLLLSAALALLLAIIWPDWRGHAGAAALLLAWLLLRWRLVAANVRQYHLPKARFAALAWLKVYLFAFGFARGGPASKREHAATRERDSGASSSGGGSGSGTSGGGGRSGGGGASGSW